MGAERSLVHRPSGLTLQRQVVSVQEHQRLTLTEFGASCPCSYREVISGLQNLKNDLTCARAGLVR